MDSLKLIGQGKTAKIYSYENGKVLKLFDNIFSDSVVKKEFMLSKYAYNMDIDTPYPYKIVEYIDRKGIVFDKIPNETFLDKISSQPLKVFNKINKMVKLHVSINKKKAPEFLNSQKSYLKKSIEKIDLLDAEQKKKVLIYLESLKEGNNICHGDFHFENILGENPYWVIDWMTGTSGDPAGDVARTVLIIESGELPKDSSNILKILSRILRKIMKFVYLKKYIKFSNISKKDVKKWMLPVAASRLNENITDKEKQYLLKVIKKQLLKI